jgi:hypothetical protein
MKVKTSSLKLMKDFQIRTYRTGKKEQHTRDKTRKKKRYIHLQYEHELQYEQQQQSLNNLSIVQGPSTVTCIMATYLSQLHP